MVLPLLNPLASAGQVHTTPSRLDGVPAALEDDLRAFGAVLIQQAGVLLNMPQVVMATACVLYQRFWFVSSFSQFGIKDIALSAVFLSAKLEETRVRIRDIVNVFDYLFRRLDHETHLPQPSSEPAPFRYVPLQYLGSEYYDTRDTVIIGEAHILKRLGFELTVVHPYGSLVNYLQVLDLVSHHDMPQCAWSFCNDALLTPLAVVWPPHYIAIAAIYLSALLVRPQVVLPPKWWEAFDVPDEESIWHVCQTLLSCYEAWGVDVVGYLQHKSSPSSSPHSPVKNDDKHDTDSNHHYSTRDIWKQAAMKALPLTKTELRRWLDRNA